MYVCMSFKFQAEERKALCCAEDGGVDLGIKGKLRRQKKREVFRGLWCCHSVSLPPPAPIDPPSIDRSHGMVVTDTRRPFASAASSCYTRYVSEFCIPHISVSIRIHTHASVYLGYGDPRISHRNL